MSVIAFVNATAPKTNRNKLNIYTVTASNNAMCKWNLIINKRIPSVIKIELITNDNVIGLWVSDNNAVTKSKMPKTINPDATTILTTTPTLLTESAAKIMTVTPKAIIRPPKTYLSHLYFSKIVCIQFPSKSIL